MDGCVLTQPLPVLHIHGTADDIVPYEGGFVENTPQPRTDPAVVDVIASWQTANDCPAAAATRDGVVTTELAAACADGTAVELITIAGGGHAWPGGRQARPGADPPSDALDATTTIWAFFETYPVTP
jgi:polyhydroxybutyrate depolymerase